MESDKHFIGKLHYYTNISIPSKFANSVQIQAMYKAFQDYLGKDRVFFITSNCDITSENIFRHGFSHYSKYKLSTLLHFCWFPLYAFRYIKKNDIVYCKDIKLTFVAIFWQKLFSFIDKSYRIILECHLLQDIPLESIVYNNTNLVVCNTNALKQILIEKYPLRNSVNTITAHDAVNLSSFDIHKTKEKAREQLSLPVDGFFVGYVGMFNTMGMSKGIDQAILAMKHVSENIYLYLIGGSQDDIDNFRQLITSMGLEKKILLPGRQPHDLIPTWLKALDICIAPFPDNTHYRYYMSPLKLFEYMASKRPIIISDLESIREVVDESTAIIIPPDDVLALANSINAISIGNCNAETIAQNAFELVKSKYTWEHRVKFILTSL